MNATRRANFYHALAAMWEARGHYADPVIAPCPDDPWGYVAIPRSMAHAQGLDPICDAENDGTWGDTDLDDFEDGYEFADMAIDVFGDEMLAADTRRN